MTVTNVSWKPWLIFSVNVFLFFFIIVVFLSVYAYAPLVVFKHPTCIIIHPEEKFSELSHDIITSTSHVSPLFLKAYARFLRIDHNLYIGEYCFDHRTSLTNIMMKIKYNKRERHKFTLVDGWTYREMIEHLRHSSRLSDIFLLDDNLALASKLNISELNMEGQFYPSTYYYAYPDTALSILQQAHELMQQKIISTVPEKLLIVASIIQKEASDPDEQRLIAGVINHRLKLHMKLQMDATVLYGLGKNVGTSLTKHDLTVDTAYNTYLHYGLPPTAICMPGETALYAAAHPKETDYLYYVSKKNGQHQFSKTLQEHNEAIRIYLKG